MKVSFIWFDMGYTLVYMQRELTYQQVLRAYGHDVSIEDLEREFHLTDKLFMREYPGIFLKDRGVYMPWFLGILNFRLGISLDVCKVDDHWHGIQKEVENSGTLITPNVIHCTGSRTSRCVISCQYQPLRKKRAC